MLYAEDIAIALNLTGVVLIEEPTVNGQVRASITANEPVTEAMQARVQAWHTAGQIADIIKLDADLVLSRLTTAEQEALFTARRTIWQVDYFLTRASTTGIISTSDSDLPAAQAMFAELGIVAADRWTDLLAP
jgi:hypothetical protein